MFDYKEVWAAAYSDAVDDGASEKEAAAIADEAVSDSMAAMADRAKELRKYGH